MKQLAAWIDRVATTRADENSDKATRVQVNREIAAEVRALCDRFPAPGLAPV
jgi:hypothetical protein